MVQVVDQVSHLFRNHNPELLTEFALFMPDDVQEKYGAASDFAAMTGASIETANYYIEMAGGIVEAAVTLYLELGGATLAKL